jgi:hypothetical protein
MGVGPRLVSIPLVQNDETLETVLQSLDGSYDHVRHYRSSDPVDHWNSFWTAKAYRDFYTIDHRIGLWIRMTRDDHLVVAGLVPGSTGIELGKGWNHVGYPSFINRTVIDALSEVDWTAVDGYSDTPPYHLRHLDASDFMAAGEGFWIRVDLPQVWHVEN